MNFNVLIFLGSLRRYLSVVLWCTRSVNIGIIVYIYIRIRIQWTINCLCSNYNSNSIDIYDKLSLWWTTFDEDSFHGNVCQVAIIYISCLYGNGSFVVSFLNCFIFFILFYGMRWKFYYKWDSAPNIVLEL